jgi:hypothetical protein
MLSNKENSVAHHAEIVTECARVLTMRSSLVSVSQQNSHTLNRNSWLDDVNGNDQISVEGDPGLVERSGFATTQGTTIPIKFFAFYLSLDKKGDVYLPGIELSTGGAVETATNQSTRVPECASGKESKK